MKKIVLKTLIFTFIISAVLGISTIFLDLWNDITGKILLSTVVIFGFSIPGLSCSTNYEKAKDKTFSIVGISTCFISCIYLLLLTWGFLEFDFFDDLNWKLILSGILLSSSFGHISLLLLIDSKEKIVNYFKNGTTILSVIMDILLMSMIFLEIEIEWKLLAIIAILIVLGTIVTPLLNKLNNKANIAKTDLMEDKYKKLEQIKSLLDSNAITQEEYEIEKNKILNP